MDRIALLHPTFEMHGGAEALCVHQALCLRAAGDDVTFVAFTYDPARWERLMDGIPVRVVRERRWTDRLRGFTRRAKLETIGRLTSQSLAGCTITVAYNHPCNAYLGAADVRARKVWQCNEPPRDLYLREANPHIAARALELGPRAAEHEATREWQRFQAEFEVATARKSALCERLRFDREMTPRVDHVFAISAFSRDNARRIYGRCAQEVVHPMVRFPDRVEPRGALQRDALQVLVQSRLSPYKNIDGVVRGFARFCGQKRRAHLHVVGEGPSRAGLEALARESLPAGTFTFHGYLPDDALAAVYRLCDVYALLCLDEPFGMVFPEAAARGLLVIGPDHGGPVEILEGGRIGWCVDPFRPDAFAEALERVVALPNSDVERMRAEADRSCRARFSAEMIAPKLRRAIHSGTD